MFAAMHGITLAMETMENDFMNTIEKAMTAVRYVDSPWLQVYPDIGNVSNATDDVVGDIKKGVGHISAAHLKETVPGKFREIPYGTGQVDFPSAIAQLYKQGVRRFVAEFWHCGEENWKEIAIFNRKFLDEQFRKAL
jgi:L-ribulose-5-phosphate 3-epimerase